MTFVWKIVNDILSIEFQMTETIITEIKDPERWHIVLIIQVRIHFIMYEDFVYLRKNSKATAPSDLVSLAFAWGNKM